MSHLAGILAAGKGTRLRQVAPNGKPLCQIKERPLIYWSINALRYAGFDEIVCVTNPDVSAPLHRFLREYHLEKIVSLVVKETDTAFSSLSVLADIIGDNNFLCVTVDSLISPFVMKNLVQTNRGVDKTRLILGITSCVNDDSPLWVRLGRDWFVEEIGSYLQNCRYITAGLYIIPKYFRRTISEAAEDGIVSLRDYLGWLVKNRYIVIGYDVGKSVDVDTVDDLSLAEHFIEEIWR